MNGSIFLSYKSDDLTAALALQEQLARSGVEVLSLAAHDGSEPWREEFHHLVSCCTAVAVLVGRKTHESDPVAWEISEAKRLGKRVVGIHLDETEHRLPTGLADVDVLIAIGEHAVEPLRSLLDLSNQNHLQLLAAEIRQELAGRHILPDGPVDDLMVGYAVMGLAKSAETTCQDVHNVWSAWIMRTEPTHPSLVPFDQLDRAVAAQDQPYADAIELVMQRHEL